MTKHGFCGDCGSSVCVWRFGLDDVAFNVSRVCWSRGKADGRYAGHD